MLHPWIICILKKKKVLQAILVGQSMVKLVWPQEEMLTRLGRSLLCSQIPERVSLHARQCHRTQHQVVRRQKTEVSRRFKQRVYRGFQGNAKQGRVNSFSSVQFSSVQSLSRVQLFATPWTTSHQASLFITNSRSLPKLMSIDLVMSSNHLILCRPLLLLPSFFPSIRVFTNESALRIRWPKYWSFSFSISPSNEYPGLISFRMDWLDLLAVQGTLKSLLQHHSSKASVLRCSAFFIV